MEIKMTVSYFFIKELFEISSILKKGKESSNLCGDGVKIKDLSIRVTPNIRWRVIDILFF